jgi:hypothetical protein
MALAIVLVSSTFAGARGSQTVIACATGVEDGFTFAPHPHRCIEYRGHERYELAGTFMSHIRWQDWGSRTALGQGRWRFCGAGGCDSGHVSLRAFDPAFTCGRTAYTRLRITSTFHGRLNSSHVYRLPGC